MVDSKNELEQVDNSPDCKCPISWIDWDIVLLNLLLEGVSSILDDESPDWESSNVNNQVGNGQERVILRHKT